MTMILRDSDAMDDDTYLKTFDITADGVQRIRHPLIKQAQDNAAYSEKSNQPDKATSSHTPSS